MHAFCGQVIGEEGYGQQRECSDCQKKNGGTGLAAAAVDYRIHYCTAKACTNNSALPNTLKQVVLHSFPRFGGGGKFKTCIIQQ